MGKIGPLWNEKSKIFRRAGDSKGAELLRTPIEQFGPRGEEDLRRLGFLENRNELLRNPFNNLAMGILFKNLPNII